jgi:hypothetical protein
LLAYVDTRGEEVVVHVELPADELNGHFPNVTNHQEQMSCAVCNLEEE